MERWVQLAKRADFNSIAKQWHITPVLARLMINRNVNTDEQIKRYLQGQPKDLYNPMSMKDIFKGATLIEQHIEAGETIAIASDFDVDGIFSAYILYRGFTAIGGKAKIYTPDRVKEGYGLNTRIVQEAYADGSRCLVTCDNGIAAFEGVALGKELGMTIVVTDHHDIPYKQDEQGNQVSILPEAAAIINPKQADCPYPFKKLCGAGVAYKLVQVLFQQYGLPEETLHNLIQYVAVATVADVMDLEDENRIFVKHGLKQLANTDNIGLKALIDAVNLNSQRISAYHIGFVIGPCFNAAGRLETAKVALDLLLETDEKKAASMAAHLKGLNDSRKEMTEKGYEQAIAYVENSSVKNDKILLVLLENCHESLVGIIAGRLKEKYHKPTIVFSNVEDGMIKGSARSIEAYNIFEACSACKDILPHFGGHPMAAGMSLKASNLEQLRQRLNKETTLTEEDFIPVVKIDAAMPVGYITEGFIEELELLEPFGKGNTKPVFAEKYFRIMKATILGKNKNVLKFRLCNDDHTMIDGIYFGNIEDFNTYVENIYGQEEKEKMYQGKPNSVELAMTYYPTINEYAGRKNIQIVVAGYCKISR